MLPVEPIGDVAFRVQLVKDPIGIVLHGRRENHYFEMLRHLSQEGLGARSHQELPIEVPTGAVTRVVVRLEVALARALGIFYVVDQGLI